MAFTFDNYQYLNTTTKKHNSTILIIIWWWVVRKALKNANFHQHYVTVAAFTIFARSRLECNVLDNFQLGRHTLILVTMAQCIIPFACSQILLLLVMMITLAVQQLFHQTWHNLIKEKKVKKMTFKQSYLTTIMQNSLEKNFIACEKMYSIKFFIKLPSSKFVCD